MSSDTTILLLRAQIAGIRYHRADTVWDRLHAGMPLALVREADNPYDGNAVAIQTVDGAKLGYVPRNYNAGIARRLDAGKPLHASAVRIWNEGRGEIEFEISSADPHDAPDPSERAIIELYRRSDQARAERHRRISSSMRFVFSSLDAAREVLKTGDVDRVLEQAEAAIDWANETWLLQQGITPDTSNGWWSLRTQVREMYDPPPWLVGKRAPPTSRVVRFPRTSHVFWKDPYEDDCGERCDDLAARPTPVAREELGLWLVHLGSQLRAGLKPPEDMQGMGGNAAEMCEVQTTPAPPMPRQPRAALWIPAMRTSALRALRRLLVISNRIYCGLKPAVTDLLPLKCLCRDPEVLRVLVSHLVAHLRESARRILLPDEYGRCCKVDPALRREYPMLYPPPVVSEDEKWALIERAYRLLTAPRPDEIEARLAAAELQRLQPAGKRIHVRCRERWPTDCDLHFLSVFLQATADGSIYGLLSGYALAMGRLRGNRLNPHHLNEIAEVLSSYLFALPMSELVELCEGLTGHPPGDFRHAVGQWEQGCEALAGDPAGADMSTLAGLRRRLEDTLIAYPCRLPRNVCSRVAAADDRFLHLTRPVPSPFDISVGQRTVRWWEYRVPRHRAR